MCGRFSLGATIEAMSQRFAAAPMLHPLTAEGVIFPAMRAAMVIAGDPPGERQLVSAVWGIPGRGDGQLLINARAETIAVRPMFAEAFACRRGLIPATSFFEWEAMGKGKLAHEYYLPDKALFAFAAIFTKGILTEANQVGDFAIITVPAASPVASSHPRMPLVLKQEMEATWLQSGRLTQEAWQSCQQSAVIAQMHDASPMPHLFAD